MIIEKRSVAIQEYFRRFADLLDPDKPKPPRPEHYRPTPDENGKDLFAITRAVQEYVIVHLGYDPSCLSDLKEEIEVKD